MSCVKKPIKEVTNLLNARNPLSVESAEGQDLIKVFPKQGNRRNSSNMVEKSKCPNEEDKKNDPISGMENPI